MNARVPRFASITIDEGARSAPLTREILRNIPRAACVDETPAETVGPWPQDVNRWTAARKRRLRLVTRPGGFLKPFRAMTPDTEPMDFYLAHAFGCPFDCAYCFLQAFLADPTPTIVVNEEAMWRELEDLCPTLPRGARIHAGEVCDALALDELTGLSQRLTAFFRSRDSITVELRTKSVAVDNLLRTEPSTNVIPAWTLSPESIWRRYERGAPSPRKRIEAAGACARHGWGGGGRLDPIIPMAEMRRNFLDGYAELFAFVREQIPLLKIESVILGVFRFTTELKEAIYRRDPHSPLPAGEYLRHADGKHRLFRPLRRAIYHDLLRLADNMLPGVPMSLCMESEQMEKDLC